MWVHKSKDPVPKILSLVLAAGRSESAGGAGPPSNSPRAGSAAAPPMLGSAQDGLQVRGEPAQLSWIERSPVHLGVCHPQK